MTATTPKMDVPAKPRSAQRKCKHKFHERPWELVKMRWRYQCVKCGAKARG